MRGFSSVAIHGGNAAPHGALRPPLYDCVAFEHEDAAAIAGTFSGRRPAHAYTRITNPTVSDFEERLRQLTGAFAVLAVSSGMAAISNTLLTLGGRGSNIVTTRKIFGNTWSLFTRTLAPWGLETRCVDMTDPEAVAAAIDGHTCAVFLESISNPGLEVADCAAICRAAATKQVPVVLDNTLTTPYLFDSRAAGVAVEILSTTKYISGGGATVGGVIIDNGLFDWRHSPRLADAARRYGKMAFVGSLRREIHRNVGACLAPHNAALQILGLETMALRIDRSCATALAVATFLKDHPRVAAVHYPGLAGSPFHEVAVRQFGRGCGGLLTFDLEDQAACWRCMDALSMIRRATNVNDNKSLILHPASTIGAEFSPEERAALGLRPTMLRLSVGIEDVDDMIDDLSQALDQV